jgi:hypothetical protein
MLILSAGNGCQDPPRPIRGTTASPAQQQSPAVYLSVEPLPSQPGNVPVRTSDVNILPHPTVAGSFIVPGACPGEYCGYGAWKFSESLTLRVRPDIASDSIGFVAAAQPICADSGFVVIDPPGVIVITETPPDINFLEEQPPFVSGDTVIVLDYTGEGYWHVRWRDSVIHAYAYWFHRNLAGGVQVVRAVRNFWWVHVTDRASGAKGWILRIEWLAEPPGWSIVQGGKHISSGQPRVEPCQ